MADYRLGEIESKFADLIWENEPLTSRRLAELALDSLNWKRTTTYTVLKRLCDRGLFQNQGGTVSSLVSRDAFYTGQAAQHEHHRQYCHCRGAAGPAVLEAGTEDLFLSALVCGAVPAAVPCILFFRGLRSGTGAGAFGRLRVGGLLPAPPAGGSD